MRKIPYVITSDSIIIHFPGDPVTINEDHPNFNKAWDLLVPLRRKPITDEKMANDLLQLVSVKTVLEEWSGGGFEISRKGTVKYLGEPLPSDIHNRILGLFKEGDKGWVALANFWARLMRNPSRNSVQQLWGFMKHQGLPICERGYLYAYKGVRTDYLDSHSGTFDNHPGKHIWMPRNRASDESNRMCDHGFHVGNQQFAKGFGMQLIVRIDPAAVVRVPSTQNQKMGVHEYWPIGHSTGKALPNDLWEPGENEYCKGFVEPEMACYEYDAYLTGMRGEGRNRDANKEEVIALLMEKCQLQHVVAAVVVDNLPFRLVAGVESQLAKEYSDAFRALRCTTKVTGRPTEAVDPLGEDLMTTEKKPGFRLPSAEKHTEAVYGGPEDVAKATAPATIVEAPKIRQGAVVEPLKATPDHGLSSDKPPKVPIQRAKDVAAKKTASESQGSATVPATVVARADIDSMNRAAMRKYVRDTYGVIPGASKWGVTKLREYVQDQWAKEDAAKEVEDLEPKPNKAEHEIFIEDFEPGNHDEVIAFLEDVMGWDWDADGVDVDEVLDGQEPAWIGPNHDARSLVARFEVEGIKVRVVPTLDPVDVDVEMDEEDFEPMKTVKMVLVSINDVTGKYIAAIKCIRQYAGLGLKEAKEIVDELRYRGNVNPLDIVIPQDKVDDFIQDMKAQAGADVCKRNEYPPPVAPSVPATAPEPVVKKTADEVDEERVVWAAKASGGETLEETLEKVAKMNRTQLREKVKVLEISGSSKLSAGDLKRLITAVLKGEPLSQFKNLSGNAHAKAKAIARKLDELGY